MHAVCVCVCVCVCPKEPAGASLLQLLPLASSSQHNYKKTKTNEARRTPRVAPSYAFFKSALPPMVSLWCFRDLAWRNIFHDLLQDSREMGSLLSPLPSTSVYGPCKARLSLICRDPFLTWLPSVALKGQRVETSSGSGGGGLRLYRYGEGNDGRITSVSL